MEKRKLVNFYITKPQHTALKVLAAQQGRTMSEIMRRGIERIISRDLGPQGESPARTQAYPTTGEA